MMLKVLKRPCKRHYILTNEWILVSPHLANRPWQEKEEVIPKN